MTRRPIHVVLGVKRAGPPEDCGGIWGYKRLQDILADPKHEEYTMMREWIGLEEDDVWDPGQFDKNEVEFRDSEEELAEWGKSMCWVEFVRQM